MNIAIIGTGNVGGNLGVRFSKAGYSVFFGVRPDKDSTELLARCEGNAQAVSVQEAVTQGDLVFLAVPGGVVLDVVEVLEGLDGKVLVDCTNPLRWDAGPVWNPPTEGSNTAAIAARAPEAKVVKAFNTFGAEFHNNPQFQGHGTTVFVAGDDSDSKEIVAEIATKTGFEPVDAGPLRNASVLENAAILWIHLATVGGQGREFVLQLLRR